MKHFILSMFTIALLANCASNKKYNLNVKSGNRSDFESTSCNAKKTAESSTKGITQELFADFPKISNVDSTIVSTSQNVEFSDDCDIIILKNGEEISAKVEEIGEDYIKYKMCDNLTGPTFNKSLDNVFMIKYSNGTKTVIEQKDNSKEDQESSEKDSENKKEDNSEDNSTDTSGILSIIFGAIGLFLLPILFSTAAIILGLFSINSKRKSKAMGWIGWALGLIGLVGWIILIAVL